MRGPSPLLLRWLSASPAAGNEAWTQGLLKCQQHQNHLTRGKPDCQAPPRVSVVSEIWAPENMHLLQVLNDMTMVLGHSPHFKDHSFEDSILPLSPDSKPGPENHFGHLPWTLQYQRTPDLSAT